MRIDECPHLAKGNAEPIEIFAHELLTYVESVIAVHNPPESDFAFGPLTVKLRIVGETFRRRLTTAIAFAQLRNAQESALAWRIAAIDGASSGVGVPPGWNFRVTSERHLERLHHSADQKLSVRYDPDTQTWRILSVAQRLAIIWTADAERLPDWDDSAPCRDLFHWMTLPTEYFLAHAAAIGIGEKGVLLTGPGGSGKSTTTGAAILRGLLTAGDDFVLIEPRFAQAYALFDSIKLDAGSAALLSDLAADAVNSDRRHSEKARIHLFGSRPAVLVPRMPIDAVLLPRLDGGPKTTFVPASHGDAMRALVPSTIFLMRGGERETARKATLFLRKLPAYRCNLGRDPREAADAISVFVNGISK
jgi:hypothetical protein